MKNTGLLCIILLLILVLLLIVYVSCNHETFNDSQIPRIIWTFWDGDNIPTIILNCFHRFQDYNKQHRFVVLSPTNITQYLDKHELDIASLKHNDSPARLSDYIRLAVLSKYGGIWTDASVICTQSFEWIHNSGKQFVGYMIKSFTTDQLCPVIESWFFACSPNCDFVKQWCAEFFRTNDFNTINDYLEHKKSQGVKFDSIPTPEYLTIHIAAQTVMQLQNYTHFSRLLLVAEDGPFKYLVDNDWDSEKAIHSLCKTSIHDLGDIKIIKMRGIDRKALEHHPNCEAVFA